MTDDTLRTAQHIVGYVSALAFFALAYLSLSPEYELTMPVIVGAVVIIFGLLNKVDKLVDLLERWRGE